MQFLARHVRPGSSSVIEEVLDGASASDLALRLRRDGSIVLAVRRHYNLSRWRRPAFDVPWWCRELETLLRAGMSPVEAIETLAGSRQDEPRRSVHEALLGSLREGASLSRAMRECSMFPEVLVAGITASERTSTLADALRDYLRYDELLRGLRRKAVSAALYPILVVGVGAIVAVFLLLYVIPRFSRMYGAFHGGMSPVTEAVLAMSRALSGGGAWVGLSAAGLAAACVLLWRAGRVQGWAVQAVDAITPLRAQWDQFRLAKLFQSLALLFRGGYTFDEALTVCEGLSLGPRMAAGIAVARARVAVGKPASSAMAEAGLADLTSQRLMAVGERTGAFDRVLQTIAERHAERFTTFIERSTRILEPLLLLAVALVVGGLVVLMYMPIFDIAGGLGTSR